MRWQKQRILGLIRPKDVVTYDQINFSMNRSSNWRSTNKPYLPGNSAEWMESGQKYFQKLSDLIDLAEEEIHLQTYIFIDDETGKKIANALIRAALRGVSVFILVDAFGSKRVSGNFLKSFTDAGIHVKKFGELYSSGRFHIGRRLHRKILVIDKNIAVVGGINISDQYAGTKVALPWLDFAILVSGQICSKLMLICRSRWKEHVFIKKRSKPLKIPLKFNSVLLRVRRNDFIRNQNEIAVGYRKAIRTAEKSILIVGGYFLPGGRTRRLFRNAVRRGVEVKILVAEKSDVGIMVHARKYLYGWLTENGIKVFEFIPSNVHGKVLVIDNNWTTIGSYDLNNLSSYSNIELNLDIKNEIFSENISTHISDLLIHKSKEVTIQSTLLQQTIFVKLKCFLAYRFVKVMFVLTFLLAGKRRG